MNWESQVAVTALIAALVEMVLHWFPWELAIHRKLHPVAAYVLGMLGLIIPLTVLMSTWVWLYELPDYPLPKGVMVLPDQVARQAIIALWSVVGAGGLAVMLAYGIDWMLRRNLLAQEFAELLQIREGERDETGTFEP